MCAIEKILRLYGIIEYGMKCTHFFDAFLHRCNVNVDLAVITSADLRALMVICGREVIERVLIT